MPEISSSASSLCGRWVDSARSVASPNTTYGGTPCSRASSSRHSRNRRAGQALAQGKTREQIEQETNMVVEGFFAVAAVYEKAEQLGVELPITSSLYDVLYHQKAPSEALWSLMAHSKPLR